MADPASFARLVPGFDFLQGLMKNASSSLPAMNQWIAPTLDPEELEKRIGELRTVQFWLEQNAKMIGATIQALEVQRMTLATLRTMNLPLSEVRDSLKLAPAPAAEPQPPDDVSPPASPIPPVTGRKAGPAKAAPGAVDPLQWWAALTQQFGELAANAMKDTPTTLKGLADAAGGGAASAATVAKPPARDTPATAKKPARRRRAAPRKKAGAG